jgi:hypothetical protein
VGSKGRGTTRVAQLGVLVAGMIAAGAVGCTSGGAAASRAMPAAQSSSRAASAIPSAAPRVIDGLVVGKAYAYRLYVQCGVGKIFYGERTWSPLPPVGQPPKNRPVPGQAAPGEYVAGTLTLEQPGILRFTADNALVAAPYSVSFRLSATPVNSACIS